MSEMAFALTVIFWLWVLLFPSEFGKTAGKTVKAYREASRPTHEQA